MGGPENIQELEYIFSLGNRLRGILECLAHGLVYARHLDFEDNVKAHILGSSINDYRFLVEGIERDSEDYLYIPAVRESVISLRLQLTGIEEQVDKWKVE